MVKKIALLVLTLALAATVIFTGCTTARKPMNTGYQNNGTGINGNANNQNDPALGNNWGTRDLAYNNGLGNNGNNNGIANNDGLGYNNNIDGLGNNVNLNTTAQRTDELERTIEQMQGVRDATVVLSGNTAYVGIDLDNNTTNNVNYENTANNTETRNTNTTNNTNAGNNTDIKNSVAQKIRASNTNINTVYVSTETDFMDRLRNVGTGVKGGRPISGFTTELRDMVRRINPMNW